MTVNSSILFPFLGQQLIFGHTQHQQNKAPIIPISFLLWSLEIMSWTISDKCGYIQHYGGHCLHPYGGEENPGPGTRLILHPVCKIERLYYCVTPQGEIRHKISGRCITPKSGGSNPPNNVELVLNDCGFSSNLFRFTAGKFQFALISYNWLQLRQRWL